MLAIGLGLLSAMTWGVGDFLGGLKSRTLPLLAVLVVSQLVGFAAIGLVTLASGAPAPGRDDAVMAALSALAGTAGLAAFYRALAIGKMSLVVPIAATSAALPVVVGIASGDDPGALQVAGMVVALIGSIMAATEPDSGDGGGRLATGAALAAASAVLFGVFFLAIDRASDGGAIWASFINRSTSVSLLLLSTLILRPPLRGIGPDLPILAVVGIFDVMANVLFAAASREGLVSLVSVSASLYPVMTLVLARVFLHERVHRTQEIGIFAALGGVVLIAAG
jgi:drug/metabolite transporter (DMT)-like permease